MRNRMYVIFALAILATVLYSCRPILTRAGVITGTATAITMVTVSVSGWALSSRFIHTAILIMRQRRSMRSLLHYHQQQHHRNNPRILQTGKKQHIAGNIRKIFWSMVKKRCPMGPPASRMMVDGGLLTDPLFN